MVGVLRSSETFLWKLGSAPCEWLAIPTQPNLPSSSSLLLFFFFACFLIFLKKVFPERKIALEIVRRRSPPNHGSINDKRDLRDRRSSKEGNLRLFDHRLKKNAFSFTFLHFFTFFTLFWWQRLLIIAWKKMPRGDLAISKTYPEPGFFFLVNHAESASLLSFCLWTCFDPTVR